MASVRRFAAYERVSTARQGQSGLGLAAQRRVIEAFAASGGAKVLSRFTEVEGGRKSDRPELAKALHLAKLTGATLAIARLAAGHARISRPLVHPHPDQPRRRRHVVLPVL